MPTFLITETRRELWHYFYTVEAESADAALELWANNELEPDDSEYLDTLTADGEIEEIKDDK